MHLSFLEVRDFRNLEHVRTEPGPGLNIIHGDNASGKTSLLEAIYCLVVGKSFLTTHHRELVRWGAERATVFGRVQGPERATRIGVGKGANGGTEARVDGVVQESLGELAWLVPAQLLGTGLQELIAGGPGERRRFLDWGVFHVERGFQEEWKAYRRALRQRNALLRAGGPLDAREVGYWEAVLAERGETVNRRRESYVARLREALSEGVIGGTEALEVVIRPGWRQGEGLKEVLAQDRGQDRERGYTRSGPHRAELVLRVGGREASLLSRGQQKALAVGLKMAQVKMLRERGRPVLVLFDDLGSELDAANRSRVSRLLAEADVQAFVTGTDAAAIATEGWDAVRAFHVEHGVLSRVV